MAPLNWHSELVVRDRKERRQSKTDNTYEEPAFGDIPEYLDWVHNFPVNAGRDSLLGRWQFSRNRGTGALFPSLEQSQLLHWPVGGLAARRAAGDRAAARKGVRVIFGGVRTASPAMAMMAPHLAGPCADAP